MQIPAPNDVLCILTTATRQHAAAWLPLLDAHERQRAVRLRREQDQDLFITAHGLKRLVLAALLDCPCERMAFRQNAFGKPALVGRGPSFNLSHSGDRVALTIAAGGNIGIDIEHYRAITYRDLAHHVLHTDEHADYAASGYDDHALLRLWTLKEAVSKAVGRGMSLPFENIAFTPVRGENWLHTLQEGTQWQARHWQGPDGTHLALAASFAMQSVHFWQASGERKLSRLSAPFNLETTMNHFDAEVDCHEKPSHHTV